MDELAQNHASETGALPMHWSASVAAAVLLRLFAGDWPKFLCRRFAANSRNSRIYAIDNIDMLDYAGFI